MPRYSPPRTYRPSLDLPDPPLPSNRFNALKLSKAFLNNLLLFVFFFTIFAAIGHETLNFIAPLSDSKIMKQTQGGKLPHP